MSFIELMNKRYTTKKYNNVKKITEADKKALKETLRLSPSSINSQPWKFTFVSDKDIRYKLSEVSWLNKGKVQDCDTVVVFNRINDLALFEEQIERELPKGAVDYYKEFIKPMPEAQIKAWFDRQVYLALGIFLSACAEMGIDSTPMEGIEPENYNKILKNKNYTTIVAVAIGYRDEEDSNQPHKKAKSRIDIDKIIETI
ncbi:NAD(P)H-dependent oxidoreductase [Pontimicrobium sp. MEBiC01747]|jgi:nitroreductase/dihydropteridine reductase